MLRVYLIKTGPRDLEDFDIARCKFFICAGAVVSCVHEHHGILILQNCANGIYFTTVRIIWHIVCCRSCCEFKI
jgi:hypothetical protein